MAREGVTIEGMIRTQAVLSDLLDRTEDLSPLMATIGAHGVQATENRFQSQAGPDGKNWEKSARAKATGGQTLVDSGILFGNFTAHHDRDSAEWGTNTPYAGVHQFGATIRAKSAGALHFFIPGIGFRTAAEVVIPPRPFLGVSAEDEDEIDAIIRDYIAEAIP